MASSSALLYRLPHGLFGLFNTIALVFGVIEDLISSAVSLNLFSSLFLLKLLADSNN